MSRIVKPYPTSDSSNLTHFWALHTHDLCAPADPGRSTAQARLALKGALLYTRPGEEGHACGRNTSGVSTRMA